MRSFATARRDLVFQGQVCAATAVVLALGARERGETARFWHWFVEGFVAGLVIWLWLRFVRPRRSWWRFVAGAPEVRAPLRRVRALALAMTGIPALALLGSDARDVGPPRLAGLFAAGAAGALGLALWSWPSERGAWLPDRLRLADPATVPPRPAPEPWAPFASETPRERLLLAAPLLAIAAVVALQLAGRGVLHPLGAGAIADVLGLGVLLAGVALRRRGIPARAAARRLARRAAFPALLLLTLAGRYSDLDLPCLLLAAILLVAEWRRERRARRADEAVTRPLSAP